jgi:hypothetical protein
VIACRSQTKSCPGTAQGELPERARSTGSGTTSETERGCGTRSAHVSEQSAADEAQAQGPNLDEMRDVAN